MGEKHNTLEIFSITTLEALTKINMRGDVTCLLTLDNIGILIGQEDGYIDILSPYYDSVIV